MKPKYLLTPFGIEVRKRLLDRNMTQAELVELVKKETGMFLDSPYLRKILTGQGNAPAVVAGIRKVLEIEIEEE